MNLFASWALIHFLRTLDREISHFVCIFFYFFFLYFSSIISSPPPFQNCEVENWKVCENVCTIIARILISIQLHTIFDFNGFLSRYWFGFNCLPPPLLLLLYYRHYYCILLLFFQFYFHRKNVGRFKRKRKVYDVFVACKSMYLFYSLFVYLNMYFPQIAHKYSQCDGGRMPT